eukprot:COSAG01_NODE_317_length_18969_cov_378.101219_4_plen_148_part_00
MNRAREETSARAASDREEAMAQARSEVSLAVQHWGEQQEQRGAAAAQSAKKEAKATLEQAMARGRAEAEAAARTVSETAVSEVHLLQDHSDGTHSRFWVASGLVLSPDFHPGRARCFGRSAAVRGGLCGRFVPPVHAAGWWRSRWRS